MLVDSTMAPNISYLTEYALIASIALVSDVELVAIASHFKTDT